MLQVRNISNNNKIAFKSNGNLKFKEAFDKIPTVELMDSKYIENRAKTFSLLGSSKTVQSIESYEKQCDELVTILVKDFGFDCIHGCGADGIMGAAYRAAKNASIKDSNNRPIQNLAILADPCWGDENIFDCFPIAKAKGETERVKAFRKVSDIAIIFPGRLTTFLEGLSLIQQNDYAKEDNALQKIIVVGKKLNRGLLTQVKTNKNAGLINHDPKDLFSIVESNKEIIRTIKKFSRLA